MHQNFRTIVEKHVIPFTRYKVRELDDSISKSRKGIKNSISYFFKKPDRGENEGLKEGFRMNKSDQELRNLCDLAFVMQDYETANQISAYPYKDFKACKAFRFAASCLEI